MPLIFSRERPDEIKQKQPEYIVLSNSVPNELLPYRAYKLMLDYAGSNGMESVILPLIRDKTFDNTHSFEQARRACAEFLSDSETSIIISTCGVRIKTEKFGIFSSESSKQDKKLKKAFHISGDKINVMRAPRACEAFLCAEAAPLKDSLSEYIKVTDKGFSETLLELIDKSGMTDVECYKRANIDRKLFSKIRSSPDYKPKKTTALSFCIALSLSLDQTKELLSKAGYTLSKSNKGDLIVEYFIIHGNYDIFEINEALFEYDQALLGV